TFAVSLDGRMRVSVVATGIEVAEGQLVQPEAPAQTRAVAQDRAPLRPVTAPAQARATNPVQTQVSEIEERLAPVTGQAEFGIEVEKVAPQVSGAYDPREFEAEVIIHKPES